MNPFQLSCVLVSVAVCSTPSPASARAPSAATEIRWEPYTTQGADREPVQGEIGRLRVPENRRQANDKTIELAFVRFRTKNPEPGPPCFYLVGGPGPSGIEHCVGPATGRMLRLLDYCDVIGLDQRGTGLSRPNLEEAPPFAYELPIDKAITREQFIAAYGDAVRRCAKHWKDQGVDLAAYNSIESADDVDDVRKALGIDKIMTWGESYGTHLTLAYLRRHADHVARSILIRVEGPDHTWKLPSTMQRHLVRLSQLCAADPGTSAALPDFLGTVRGLLRELAQKPAAATVDVGGVSTSVVIGPFDLQCFLANALGLAFELRDVPAAVHRMTRGDWSAVAESALANRRGEVGSAMALMVDCSSGATEARLKRMEKERSDPVNLLGDAVNAPYPGACAACGSPDLGDGFRGALKCSVPVLFVSGDLDAKTPPENVEEIARGFSDHAHVVATNAGHESIEMLSPEYRELLQAFVRGGKVVSRTIELPPVRFRPIETQ